MVSSCRFLWYAVTVAVFFVPDVSATGGDGALCSEAVPQNAPYLNPKHSTDARVLDLLERMCWQEKVAQLGGVGGLLSINSTYNATKYSEIARLHNGTISPGEYLNYAEEAVPVILKVAAEAKEQHRLHIPYINVADSVNGVTLRGTTLFPATLSMSNSWNQDLFKSVITAIRDELLACGINWVLSPDLDVSRDPRNGRNGETYGEDNYIISELATEYVKIMEEVDEQGFMKIATTIKHFVYGEEHGGVNLASMYGGINHIYNDLAAPFIKVLQRTKPASVMPSYASIDRVPAHANRYLLQDVLRGSLGFEGIILSDADAISQLYNWHKISPTLQDAGLTALAAGVQSELAINFPTGFEQLVSQSASDAVVNQVNEAVRQLMTLKYRLGLFDRPVQSNRTSLTTLRSPKHISLAKTISQESIVLLQNDGFLPLVRSANTRVALIGPLAEVVDTGTYAAWTNSENGNKTLVDAVKDKFGADNVVYVRGVPLTETTSDNISDAAIAAQQADIVIISLGAIAVGWGDSLANQRTDGEGFTHSSLGFPGLQQDLLDAVIATGKPVILVLSGGQAFELEGSASEARAIIHSFLAGEYTAEAVVGIITGAVNPSGKITTTFPIASVVNPVYYNRLPSDYSAGAINLPKIQEVYRYPFGYGLSYTTFSLSNGKVSTKSVSKSGVVSVSTTITNTGSIAGQEVVQLYFRQNAPSAIELPTKRLTGFTKVTLTAGESKQVQLQIPVKELGYYVDGKYRVDTAVFSFYVGTSSSDKDLQGPFDVSVS